jgi:predicted RNase H-like HicB family nuclease
VALTIEIDREVRHMPEGIDVPGRWIAEVPDLPGCLAYGAEQDEAVEKVKVLAHRIVAERRDHGELAPEPISS